MKRGYSISAKFYKIKETTKCVFVWIGKINWIIVIVIELASTVRWEGGGQGGARWGGCEMDEGELRGDEGKRWFDVMRGEGRESLWGESVVWCVRWGEYRRVEWGSWSGDDNVISSIVDWTPPLSIASILHTHTDKHAMFHARAPANTNKSTL